MGRLLPQGAALIKKGDRVAIEMNGRLFGTIIDFKSGSALVLDPGDPFENAGQECIVKTDSGEIRTFQRIDLEEWSKNL